MTKERIRGFILGLSVGYALAYFLKPPANRLDLHRDVKQPVKTQSPFNGELSHGPVAKDIHQGV